MAATSLQSRDHRDLLDIIDKLRSQGITRWVDLPDIIVCGDQSSGKSSVLEAISGMSFPTKDNLCTRFATELILRRGTPTSNNISLNPDPTRPDAEQLRLCSQKFDLGESLDLEKVVNTAKSVMGLDGTNKGFSTDTLRIELCGSTQPHLTMVDLPGLFQAGNREQSEEDAKLVRELVMGYMKRQRSIILAVVSAKSDFALQEITALARQLDPHGDRTLGLITKPDTLDVGSDSERAYLELAQNKDVRFRPGWHVLKNRDYAIRDASSAERDEAEEEFLSNGVWTKLELNQLGVKTLRPRLSNVLKNQILLHLPALLGDVESGIVHCNTTLAKLGASRATLSDQRRYLGKVGQGFSILMQAAVDGEYSSHSFFGDSPL
jgi:GTP-binding protein EngB required for normal cell division